MNNTLGDRVRKVNNTLVDRIRNVQHFSTVVIVVTALVLGDRIRNAEYKVKIKNKKTKKRWGEIISKA